MYLSDAARGYLPIQNLWLFFEDNHVSVISIRAVEVCVCERREVWLRNNMGEERIIYEKRREGWRRG